MMGYITDRKARAIRPHHKPVQAGVTGLYLFPGSEAGVGKWIMRYVSPVTGKRRDMGLGTFPDTGVARVIEKALAAREQIQDDIDPIMARQNKRTIPTFEQAARDHWAIIAPGFRNDKHRAQWISSLEQHVFPTIGSIRVDRLEAAHFFNVLSPIWLSIPATAQRVKMRCSNVMAACRARKLISTNPLEDVGPLLPQAKKADMEPARHHPAMPWPDVPEFVHIHLSRKPIAGARAALLFTLMTAARSGNVRDMTWKEIDFNKKLWTIPAEHMKARRQHRVPLTDDAIELLRAQCSDVQISPGALVFPALRGGVLSDMALTSILRKAHAPSDTPGRIATVHGFRTSFRNWAADHQFGTEIAERALAHTIANKVQAAYERTDRLDARVAMMAQWSDHIMGRAAVKVVPIKHRA